MKFYRKYKKIILLSLSVFCVLFSLLFSTISVSAVSLDKNYKIGDVTLTNVQVFGIEGQNSSVTYELSGISSFNASIRSYADDLEIGEGTSLYGFEYDYSVNVNAVGSFSPATQYFYNRLYFDIPNFNKDYKYTIVFHFNEWEKVSTAHKSLISAFINYKSPTTEGFTYSVEVPYTLLDKQWKDYIVFTFDDFSESAEFDSITINVPFAYYYSIDSGYYFDFTVSSSSGNELTYPKYEKPNDKPLKDMQEGEKELNTEISSQFEQVKNDLNLFGAQITNLDVIKSFSAMSNALNHLFEYTWVRRLVFPSLLFGVFAFIIGVSTLISRFNIKGGKS